MLKHLLGSCALLAASIGAHAQFVFSFDDLPLDSANYDYTKMVDTGDYYFDQELQPLSVRFFGRKEPWGGFAGFTYSNMTDTTTQSFTNDKAAIVGKGYNNSEQYAVYYGPGPGLKLSPQAYLTKFYITNTTFAALSMRNGDAFAKKFGGVSGNDPDYFFVTIYAYLDGEQKPDSVNFYLADFRSPNNADDYIVTTWEEVLLPSSFGSIDSLSFTFYSSDTGAFGINTPTYFCLDEMVFSLGGSIASNNVLEVEAYPNPVSDYLQIKNIKESITFGIYDISGKLIKQGQTRGSINVSALLPARYFLKVRNNKGDNGTATFIKY